MIQRFHDKAKFGDVIPAKDGELIFYADHVATIDEKDKEIERLQKAIFILFGCDVLNIASRCPRCADKVSELLKLETPNEPN